MRLPQTTISPARRTAYHMLLRVETEGSYTSHLLQSERMERLNPADRRLTTELVLGVLRWKRQLDWFAENYAGRKTDEIDLEAQILLRMAFYQLRFLTKIPPHAVVHEAVELAKVERLPNLSGFINAILRRSLRDPDLESRMALIKDPVRRLSIMGSHPEWLVARWIQRFGEERTLPWLLANNATPTTTLHINTRKTTQEAVAARLQAAKIKYQPSEYFPDALCVVGVAPALTQIVAEGLGHLQDEASRMIPMLLGDCTGRLVLDLCAAPGGKTLVLAQAVGDTGRVLAADLYWSRQRVLLERSRKLSCSNIRTIVADATGELPFRQPMDDVLVDAPCSGLGTVLRNPEIKWKLEPEDLRQLADKQRALLTRAAPVIRAGGRLLYSTCSTEPEENEAVVQAFLQDHPEFVIDQPALIPATERFYDRQTGYFRTFPAAPNLDGFFAVVLRKDQPDVITTETQRAQRNHRVSLAFSSVSSVSLW